MEKTLIEPKILKGFRDCLPELAIARQAMIRTLEDVFSSFGLIPIDTPALEYAEILLGKGGQETDRQLYRFLDNGQRDVALRFDLTVPLARFVAMHVNELGTPFKRYHIAPVWRAEKPQRGRYREFIQCDFDIIGTTSTLADAEIVAIIIRALSALQINHQVKVNNRVVLNGLLESLEAREKVVSILRAIDKLKKLGAQAVTKELEEDVGLSKQQIDHIFSFLQLSEKASSNSDLLRELKIFLKNAPLALEGVSQLENLISLVESFDVHEQQCKIDLSLARGLEYYTGAVFETVLTDLPQIGSICGGGRYDNLAGLYTHRELPGVGASIGLDRILGAFEELGRVSGKSSTAKVLVTIADAQRIHYSASISHQLRNAGFPVELYPEPAKLGVQLKYADRKKIPFVIIAGEEEMSTETCCVKNLLTQQQQDNILLGGLVEYLRKVSITLS